MKLRGARLSRWMFLGLVGSLAACSDEPPIQSAPRSAKPLASAKPSSSVKRTSLPPPTTTASASTSALPVVPPASANVPRGPVKWADYPGPFDKVALKGGETVWCVLPVSVGWGTLEFATRGVSHVDGTWITVKKGEDEFLLPPAFVQVAAAPPALAKGDAVLVSAHDTGLYGRVLETGEKVKVRFRFGSAVEELEVDKASVLKLDGKLGFGAPVLVQEELEDRKKTPPVHAASFVSTGGGSTWVLLGGGKPERFTSTWVYPMSVGARKVGDKVWLVRQDEALAGVVLEVLDDDLRYKLKLDNGSETTASFESVTGAISGTRAN